MGAGSSVTELVAALDDAIEAAVLVTGPECPTSPRLELIARDREFRVLGTVLAAHGLLRRGSTWAGFAPGTTAAVELVRAESLAPEGTDGIDRLFEGALPSTGRRHLLRPAPAVTLALLARALLDSRGMLTDDLRHQASEAAASGPSVWTDALRPARALGMPAAPGLLCRALGQPEGWTRARRMGALVRLAAFGPPATRAHVARAVVRLLDRPTLVSLSGPDGSGKSTQAGHLRQTLESVGVSTAGAWVPTTKRPPLPRSIRAVADRWRRPPAPTPSAQPVARTNAAASSPRSVPPHVRLAEHAWITSAAVSNAAKLWVSVVRARRTQVLVLDRFTLDADVKLTYWYAVRRGVDIGFERRLFRLIAPTPAVAVYLAVRPETNHARRADEWELAAFRDQQRIYAEAAAELHAVVVDAERTAPDVARDVAEVVWRKLR